MDVSGKAEQMRAKDALARERWVASQKLAILRDELNECFKREGVNHRDNCKEFAQAYYDAVQQLRHNPQGM
eukprot:m.129439 g.129439  ORF g.129439 m.129439 type:complete len:71 (-) comp16405_c0_seq6:2718-2930(-)